MKSILLASDFLIVGHALQNLCEIVTRSGKQLKFVENKTVENYFETTHLKLFKKFTEVYPKNLRYKYVQQNLPRWFDNDDFHCNHCGEVVETCFLPS